MRNSLILLLSRTFFSKAKSLLSLVYKIPPVLVFISIFLLTIYWSTFLPQLKFNYNIESFFSSEDPEVELYSEHRQLFENENDYVLIGLQNKRGVFEEDFLTKLDSLTSVLSKLDGITKVYSPTNIKEFVKSSFGTISVPILHPDQPEKYTADKSRIFSSGLYLNSFFSSDTSAVSILLKKRQEMSKQENDSLLINIEQLVRLVGFNDYHLAGRIKTQNFYVKKMREQMGLFSGLASLLFIISLYIIFRKVAYVILSFTTVIISLIWIFGIIGLLGIQLDLMLTMLPTLIFIIGTSTSIHFISKFRENYKPASSKKKAIKKAVQLTGLPNFLNAFTTAVGFASLIMIPVMPIQRFGLLVGMGILLSFFIGLPFIVSVLRFFPIKPFEYKKKISEERSNKFIDRLLGRPKTTVLISGIIVLVSIILATQIKTSTNFLDDLKSTAKLKQDLNFFENNFSGIRPFELNIKSNGNTDLNSLQAFKEMNMLEVYLNKNYGAGFLLSPVTIVKSFNKATHGGNSSYFKLPESETHFTQLLKQLKKNKVWRSYLPVIDSSFQIARISGRTFDEGSYIFEEKNEHLYDFINENTPNLQVHITGAAHLMDNANSHIAWNLSKGMLIAISITTLIILLFTASIRLALISLVPNLIPMILVAGFMGATGVPLKVATALIFTIAYGIAVDDTIHFLNSYRLNLKKTGNKEEAAKLAIHKMWRPMLFTSIVLFSGFMIFTLSDFSSISLLGILISSSLVVALIADLLLLPVIIRLKIRN